MNLLRYCFAVRQANENWVRKLQISDDTINFRTLLIQKLESSVKATKFGRQVVYSFPSQISKFRVLLHFADVTARRHSLAIAWSMFGHTYTFCLVAVHFTSYRKVCTCTRAWLGVWSNECCTWALQCSVVQEYLSSEAIWNHDSRYWKYLSSTSMYNKSDIYWYSYPNHGSMKW